MPFPLAAFLAFSLGLLSRSAEAGSATSSCFEYGVDYSGYDILTLSGVSGPLLCQESCAQSADCGYWSFDTETNMCYLKSDAALLGRVSKAKIVSGPRSCLTQDGCFADGVDYVGYDLKRIEGAELGSAEACQALCQQQAQCAFFSYKKSIQGCYLKSAAAPIGRTVDADVISGPRVCSGQPENVPLEEGSPSEGDQPNGPNSDQPSEELPEMPEKTCVEASVEYRGHDLLVTRNAKSAAYCQHLCASNSACFFWTWDKTRKTCSLKDQFAPDSRYSSKQTLSKVSGAKDCIPVYPDVCIEQADYVGHDLVAIEDGSVQSAVQCRTICRQTEGCAFFTWVRSSGNCYLKTEDALLGKNNSLSSLGKFSGPRECYMHYGCLEPNAAYLSASATSLRNINSFKDCEQKCQQTDSCKRWTYIASGRACLLLGANDRTPKVRYDGAISGSDCRNTQSGNDHKCLTLGVKFMEMEMAIVNTRSVNDCHYECVSTPGCEGFTFEEGVGCYLYSKSPYAMAKLPGSYSTAISGSLTCGDTGFIGDLNSCYSGELIESASFYAFDDAECAAKCAIVPSCKFWTYTPKDRFASCKLHRRGAVKTSCLESRSGVNMPIAATFDFHFYDAPATTIPQVNSAQACRAQCVSNNMHYWSYFKDTKVCQLHEEGGHSKVMELQAICGTAEDPLATR
ncbi:hypothetical protein Efla_001150 [Eimeria flavescens]